MEAWEPKRKLTRQEVEAGMSPRGGFSRATLEGWGVPWPPPKGWRRKLEIQEPKARAWMYDESPPPAKIDDSVDLKALVRAALLGGFSPEEISQAVRDVQAEMLTASDPF